MSEFKPTPGEIKPRKWGEDLKTIPLKAISCERRGFSVAFVNGHSEDVADANAELIANTFNTYHATGMTPSQLAERVKVLEDALRDLLEAADDAWPADRPCSRIAREALAK